MKIAFTVCSNNYLAQAKTLGDSLKKTNPEYQFYIGLVDKLNDKIDYSNKIAYPIILAEEIGIPNFDYLWKKYSIIEFNTCIRSFLFGYFIDKYPELEYLFYLDPDLYVYNSFNNIEIEFAEDSNILITPHVLSPINLDDKLPNEQLFLNYGIYNLGFVGLKYPTLSKEFICWLQERVYNLGYNRPHQGLFVDQLWFNLVPIFFEKVKVSSNYGLNMAPWNLHERKLNKINEEFIVNQKYPLIFYHFSNYKYSEPNTIADFYDRFSFENRNDIIEIYQKYNETLIENNIIEYSKIKCDYMIMRLNYLNELKRKGRFSKNNIKKVVKELLPPILVKMMRKIYK